jgi:hypothetical protein
VGVAYAIEKLDVAVDALAASASSIQDRLFNAYISALIRIKPEEDLPEELRPRFIAMSDRLTSAEPRAGEGSLRATLDVLADDEAVGIAQEVVNLWRELHVDRRD